MSKNTILSFALVLAFATALTGCDNDNTSVFIEDEVIEVDDTGLDEDTVDETIYHVPDVLNQVHETDTRLEFRSAVHWQQSLYEYSENVPLIHCATVTIGVPEDAGQGVFMTRFEYGSYGFDIEGSGWMEGMQSFGTGNIETWIGNLQIFRDSESDIGAEFYSLSREIYVDSAQNYHSEFGCWSEGCETRAYGVNPYYYIPAGEDATIGLCSIWRSPGVINWETQEREYGEPTPDDWAYAMFGEIQWMPADSQDFVSDSVDGIYLPARFSTFEEVAAPE